MRPAFIRNRQRAHDDFVHLDDDSEIDRNVSVLVSYARWQREHETLRDRSGPLGIRIPSDLPATELGHDAGRFSVIAIELPAFTDGRVYTTARLLRHRYRYRGELRATGNVLRDQLQYLERCGFDAFELDGRHDPDNALSGFEDFSVKYQPAIDETEPLFRRVNRCFPKVG
jgi:uncharacterized protein (DUF934 family)